MNPKDQNEPSCQSILPPSHLKLYVSKTVANLLYFSKSNSAKGQGRVKIGRIPFLTPEFEHIKC